MTWIRACAVDDLAPGEATVIGDDPAIAVFHADGEWFATADMCTHDRSSLAEGYVEGDIVECAWHFAQFCLRTGAVMSPPARQPVTTFPTRVENGVVYVEV